MCGQHEGCIFKALYATLVKVDTMPHAVGRVDCEEVTYTLFCDPYRIYK